LRFQVIAYATVQVLLALSGKASSIEGKRRLGASRFRMPSIGNAQSSLDEIAQQVLAVAPGISLNRCRDGASQLLALAILAVPDVQMPR